jgi:tetratricopeptide (TPR) repeat protein
MTSGQDCPVSRSDTSPQTAAQGAASTASRTAGVFCEGQTLAGRYLIIRMLGWGGLGEVYEARDLQLGELVAIKTLLPEIADDERAITRFKAEIQLARKVTNRHICRIFDLGQDCSNPSRPISFLSMELVAGETLSQRLRRNGPFSSAEACPIVEQIAEGLDAAHHAGVVHRDLKSSNVMLSSVNSSNTRVVITDFGLAQNLHRNQDGSEPLTGSGRIVGTPQYMSPEQLVGGEITEASDIYAFGIVMYEMLTGKRPFEDRDPVAAVAHRLNQPIISPRVLNSGIDLKWEAVILRCLAPHPRDRFRSAGAAVRAIAAPTDAELPETGTLSTVRTRTRRQWLALTGVLLALLLATGWPLRQQIARLWPRAPQAKHIAVLPFRNIGGDAANQAFCDGVAETLAAKLAQLERFQNSFWVVPMDVVRRAGNPSNVHRALGVNYVLTGSVQRFGDSVRMIVHLVDADSNRIVNSSSIDTSGAQLPSLQDEVWAHAASMLDLQLPPNTRHALQAGATSIPGAYESYLEGLGYLRRPGIENTQEAIKLFQKSLERDGSYALAFAGLGEAFAKKYDLTRDPRWIDLARSHGERAAQLNRSLAPVHLALGQIYFNTGLSQGAVREMRTALEIDPSAAQAYYWLGRAYEQQANYEAAETNFRKMIDLRPDYWMAYYGLGWFQYVRGRFADAAAEFQTVIRLLPYNPAGYENLGACSLAMGRYSDAIATLKHAIQLGASASAYSNLGTAYIALQHYPEAVPIMHKAVELSPNDDRLWRNLGDAYSLAPGLSDKAPSAYRQAVGLAEAALKIKPDDPETLSNAALYWAKLGQKPNALSRIAKAVKLKPSDNEVLFDSALVYELTGDRKRALEALAAASKAGYSLDDISQAPELSRLRDDSEYKKWRQTISGAR